MNNKDKFEETLQTLRESVKKVFGENFENRLFDSILFFNENINADNKKNKKEVLLDYIHILKDNLELMNIDNFKKMKKEFMKLTSNQANEKSKFKFIIIDNEQENEKGICIEEILEKDGFQNKIKKILNALIELQSALNRPEKNIDLDRDDNDRIEPDDGGPDL